MVHTSYLSFPLHRQDFQIQNFTPRNNSNLPQKSKICSFFAFNLEKFTPDRIFYTGSARGARDKYEVCVEVGENYEYVEDDAVMKVICDKSYLVISVIKLSCDNSYLV